jgi:aminoglycoside phosphotransferase (APT) family kinase protein
VHDGRRRSKERVVPFQPTTLTADDVRAVLRIHLPGRPLASVTRRGEGWDNVVFAVDDELLVRFGKNPDPAARAALTRREGRVLAIAARVVPVPVPEPLLVVPELGCLAYRPLPGVPLIDLRHAVDPAPVAAVLGDLVAALYAVPPGEVSDVVELDDDPPAQWLTDAVRDHAAAERAVPGQHRAAVEAFLADPAPAPAACPVLAHDDLGIEHVLVDPGTHAVTGIIDWTDAALVDPAVDPGRILRDLGPDALDTALTRCGRPDLRDRALFYARCMALDDLAFGVGTSWDADAEKALDALRWLFPPASLR